MVFDAPPSIGGDLRRAVDKIATANGVANAVTPFVYSHHHADHGGAASLFGDVVRIGARRPSGCCCATTPARPSRR